MPFNASGPIIVIYQSKYQTGSGPLVHWTTGPLSVKLSRSQFLKTQVYKYCTTFYVHTTD